jgi:hypothetical protein
MVFLLHTALPVNSKTLRLFLIGNSNFILRILWFEVELVDVWTGEDESTLEVINCRWWRCGAVLQSKAHALRHLQVVHVGKVVVGSFAFGR